MFSLRVLVAVVVVVAVSAVQTEPPCSSEVGVDYHGNDLWLPFGKADNAKVCDTRCRNNTRCNAFMYNIPSRNCYIKTAAANRRLDNPTNVAGICKCARYVTPVPALPPMTCATEMGVDYTGNDIWSHFHTAENPVECQKRCWNHAGCVGFVYHPPSKNCYLKSALSNRNTNNPNNMAGVCNKLRNVPCTSELGADYKGNDLTMTTEQNAKACRNRCSSRSDCKAYTYNVPSKHCFLKSRAENRNENNPQDVTGKCGLEVPFYPPPPCTCSVELGADYSGNDIRNQRVSDAPTCREMCLAEIRCKAYTFNFIDNMCYLKHRAANRNENNPNNVAGICN